MAVDQVRSTEKPGSSATMPGHGKWRKACINICEHIEILNCVLLRVPINNNYEQPIALFIILTKNTFMNHHGVIYCWRQVNLPT